MSTIVIDGKVYRATNPLGEEELEAARKSRERLEQLVRPRTEVDIKKQVFARRYYRNRDKKL